MSTKHRKQGLLSSIFLSFLLLFLTLREILFTGKKKVLNSKEIESSRNNTVYILLGF